MALLKATQPQADASLQALMFRIEQLESRLGGAGSVPDGGSAEAPPSAGAGSNPSPPPVAKASGGGAVAAAAVVEDPDEEPQALATVTFERICELWPALCEAVSESNAMVAAVLTEARPSALEGDKLTVTFAEGAAFMRKKAEANAELLKGAVRGLTGQALTLGFELGGPVAAPATLSEDELIARLKERLAAEEVFDEEEEQS
jgi:hypothetical protein